MRAIIVVFCFMVINGCNKSEMQTDRLLMIRTGVAYGFCHGLCDHEFTLKNGTMTYRQKSNVAGTPDKICELTLSTTEWEKLESLVDDRFFELDSVYGCPDCADQGREYVIVTTENREYGINIDPNIEIAIHPLVERLRSIRYDVDESTQCQ